MTFPSGQYINGSSPPHLPDIKKISSTDLGKAPGTTQTTMTACYCKIVHGNILYLEDQEREQEKSSDDESSSHSSASFGSGSTEWQFDDHRRDKQVTTSSSHSVYSKYSSCSSSSYASSLRPRTRLIYRCTSYIVMVCMFIVVCFLAFCIWSLYHCDFYPESCKAIESTYSNVNNSSLSNGTYGS